MGDFDSDDEAEGGLSRLVALGPERELRAFATSDSALLVCANVGDSLCYVEGLPSSSKLQPAIFSHDHRLDRNAAEQQRARNQGGDVRRDGDGVNRPLRLWRARGARH